MNARDEQAHSRRRELGSSGSMARRTRSGIAGTMTQLAELSRQFGSGVAARKAQLLHALLGTRRIGASYAARLNRVLGFMRAYPDGAAVLAGVRRVAERLPAPEPVTYPYSCEVVIRLLERFPDRVEIAWDDLEDDGPLIDLLSLLVTPGEELGLEDTSLSVQEWCARCRPRSSTSDLAFVMRLLRESGLSPRLQAQLYEQGAVPVRWTGRWTSQIVRPASRPCYQRRPVSRRRVPLAPIVRRPIDAPTPGGAALLDLALETLAVRTLEIYPLTHGNPADVTVVDCGRGLRVILIGVVPSRRSPLALHVFLITKNEMPIAYGPAAVFAGCCEMGINVFPEYRGGDIRAISAQFMRVLHHWLGVDYFYLTRYGMGEGNAAALGSGAFWFYRKLGFRPTNPEVERLAQAEEARMRSRPGYRSDRRMLVRLSRTEACFDVSDGVRRPFPFGALGMAASRMIAREFDGDRRRAIGVAVARLAALLDVPAQHPALGMLAPLLHVVPDLETWSRADIRRLAAIVRAKGATSERRAALGFNAHATLERAWRRVSRPEAGYRPPEQTRRHDDV